jgi:hypothetical protein
LNIDAAGRIRRASLPFFQLGSRRLDYGAAFGIVGRNDTGNNPAARKSLTKDRKTARMRRRYLPVRWRRDAARLT